jgi:hypothetical protein
MRNIRGIIPFFRADTLVANDSQWSAWGTAFPTGNGYQDHCSVLVSSSSSFLACTETDYASGTAYTTGVYTDPVNYVTFTFPVTQTLSASPSTTTTPSTSSSTGPIIGGVIGAVVFLVIAASLLVFYCRGRNPDPIVTMEDNQAMQPGLDSPVMGDSLPQVPFYPSLPRQNFTEGRTPGPNGVQFNPYSISEMDTESQTAIEASDRSPRSVSFPSPTGTSFDVKSQSTKAEMITSFANSPSAPHTGPDQEPPSIAAGSGENLRPELEVLRAEVERLRQIVTPDVAPPTYDG